MYKNLLNIGTKALMVLVLIGDLIFCETDVQVVLIDKYSLKTFNRIARSSIMKLSNSDAWHKEVPQIEEVKIRSTMDSSIQPALFYNSKSDVKKPLLVVLHSWSEDYYQQYSIPYGVWAVKNDWVFIHPDYRGAFTNAKATASELSIQDILDALSYAKANASIDSSRIYLTGFSGGAMVTLIMVGRFPDIWAGAVAWVPVYDLTQWYQTTRNARHNYSKYIIESCGGPPVPNSAAFNECKKRSASTYLSNAKGKSVNVFIAAGINDPFVPPGHSIQAYNDLADTSDQISQKNIKYIDSNHSLPQHLSGIFHDELMSDAGLDLLYERSSSNVLLKIFQGSHDVIYNVGLVWLSKQKK